MVLTKGDDYPLHQTPEPVAYAGTDRNFYDRYFFNGYSPDGATFFALALGVYPHLDVVDAHFCVIRNGIQHCLHASAHLGMERLSLMVGPIAIEIAEPLQRLRLRVEGEGIAADISFAGRAFPIEEPRFIWRRGPRTVMDYTRLTQNGHYEGWISVDGVREALPVGTVGTRDRSWGVRPIGASDPQGGPAAGLSQFFWQWTPVNLPGGSLFFHINADEQGQPWNTRAAWAPDGAGVGDIVEGEGAMQVRLAAGTRWPESADLALALSSGPRRITFKPFLRFQMRGLGYTSPKWGHGLYHGPLEVEREDIDLSAIDPLRIDNLHVQMLCRVRDDGGRDGLGVFEQLVIGPSVVLGLTQLLDGR